MGSTTKMRRTEREEIGRGTKKRERKRDGKGIAGRKRASAERVRKFEPGGDINGLFVLSSRGLKGKGDEEGFLQYLL